MKAFKSDLITRTEKNLSKKIKIKAIEIPNAKFIPIPPLRLNEETDTASKVKINTEKGILILLFLSNIWSLSNGEPLSLSFTINLFNSKKFKALA